MKERIAKFIARCGVCSRRDAEKLIESGRVKVNGKVLETPAFTVSESDLIEVDGQKIKPVTQIRLWLFYKPKQTITSNSDPEGRDTIFEFLPEEMPRVVTIGRLDYNTEGLLLLTNSGEFARKMELPSSEIEREYRVRIEGAMKESDISKLKAGVSVDGIDYKSIVVIADEKVDKERHNSWIRMILKEGKNREIRKVLDYLGHQVSRLIRVRFGAYSLKPTMKPGDAIEVKAL